MEPNFELAAAVLHGQAADKEIERLRETLAGIVEWSVDHADARRRAQNALKPQE